MVADRSGSRTETLDIAIVGGGIAGLAAAFQLAQRQERSSQPVRFAVLEADSVVGGKVRTERTDGFVIEQGPDSFLVRKPAARQLCLDLGLERELVGINPAASGTSILHEGRLVPMPASMVLVAPTRLLPFVTTPLLSLRGKCRAAMDLVLPAGPPTDDESIEGFVQRRLGSEIATRLAVPLLGGVYGGGSGNISLEATFPDLRRLEEKHRSLLLGLRTVERRRRSAPPAPAFETLRGGLQTMVDAIVGRLPAGSVRTGRRVERIEPLADGSTRRYRLLASDGEVIETQTVILAVPAPAAAQLLSTLDPMVAELLRAIEYGPSLLVALAFPAGAVGAELYGTGFLVPASARHRVAACTYVHRKWPHTAPRGHALFRCFLGGDDLAAMLDWPDEQLVAAVRAEIDPLLKVRGEHRLARVYRWWQGTPRYTPGHLRRMEQVESRLATLPGLALAGASYRGLGLPDCIRQGQEAAERALTHLATAVG